MIYGEGIPYCNYHKYHLIALLCYSHQAKEREEETMSTAIKDLVKVGEADLAGLSVSTPSGSLN